MNTSSLLSFLASAVFVYLGIFALKLDPKSRTNRAFMLLCGSFALWAFAYTFVYLAGEDELSGFWFRVSAPGWCMFSGVALHFFLLLTRKEEILRMKWVYLPLYLPGILLIYEAWTGTITLQDFAQAGFGLGLTASPQSSWIWLYKVNYLLFMVISLSITWLWGRKSETRREKKQAGIIVYTTISIFLLILISDIFFTIFESPLLPGIMPVFLLFWALGIYYAITRHSLMILTPQVATDEILSRIMDLFILTTPEGKITRINSRVESLLGRHEDELIGEPINAVILEEEVTRDAFSAIREIACSFYSHDVNYKTAYGEYIPVNISCSAVRDSGDELLGIVIVGQDERQTHQLYEEIAVRKRTEDALMRTQAELEMHVKQRTAELAHANEILRKEIVLRQSAEEALKEKELRLQVLSGE